MSLVCHKGCLRSIEKWQTSDERLPVVRKLVFGVSDQVQHKRGCTATEDG